jgi:thiamine-phosphate pyrophosphorylase
MVDFKLCVVTNGASTDDVATACACGVRAVQYRDPNAPARIMFERACSLSEIAKKYSARLFVNERIDIAKAAGASGAHCPERGFPARIAREILGGEVIIGVSTHSVAAAKRAEDDGADFIFYGPVFETTSKPDAVPQGLPKLREVCGSVNIPVFAIGGVKTDNARTCLESGARGVAVVSAVFGTRDVAAAAGNLLNVIGER